MGHLPLASSGFAAGKISVAEPSLYAHDPSRAASTRRAAFDVDTLQRPGSEAAAAVRWYSMNTLELSAAGVRRALHDAGLKAGDPKIAGMRLRFARAQIEVEHEAVLAEYRGVIAYDRALRARYHDIYPEAHEQLVAVPAGGDRVDPEMLRERLAQLHGIVDEVKNNRARLADLGEKLRDLRVRLHEVTNPSLVARAYLNVKSATTAYLPPRMVAALRSFGDVLASLDRRPPPRLLT